MIVNLLRDLRRFSVSPTRTSAINPHSMIPTSARHSLFSCQRDVWLVVSFFVSCHSVSAETFSDEVRPILERRCFRCHGSEEQNGSVRLDTLSADLVSQSADAESWHDALNAINLGEMPPGDEPPLTKAERTAVVDWLTVAIDRAIKSKRETGGRVVMRRLNRVEYQNTMRDLLGLDIDYARDLPPDELSEDGFANNGAALRMSAMQLNYYLQSARSALRRTIVDGPEPTVFEHHATETVADKGRENWTHRLGRTGVFVARVSDFPDEGEFVIRVKARAEVPENAPLPQMEVTLGYRADTQTPSKPVGLIDVSSPVAREFEFRGRIEEFPLQSRTQSKYPGLLIWIRNSYTDGLPAPEPRQVPTVENGKKRKRTTPVWDEDPDFPKIVIESVEFTAPVFLTWPPHHHRRILPARPKASHEERSVAESALRQFMNRAMRRPVEDDAVQAMLGYFTTVRPTVERFEEAFRETLAMVLISPEFLYRIESSRESNAALDGYELASRLSYFLWNTMPDDRLFELASDGALLEPEILKGEVSRMLESPRSWSFVEEFSNQWLDLSGINRVAINPNYYPDFNTDLKADMQRETQHFFAEVLHEDLSALSFLQSDFALLNQPLAAHYGISGPRGSSFERVTLPADARRGGLLTQASILLANSTGEDSHPIERGVWIRTALLDDPPAPPPPNVPNLDNEGIDTALLPLRQQLELHRENAACAHCHERIDPWGVALEEFNAVGLRRTSILRRSGKREAQHPVEASAELPDGHTVRGVDELTRYLVEHQSHAFAKALTTKLLTYALGRTLELRDEATIDVLTSEFIQSDYRLKRLLEAIVMSEPFLNH